MVFKRQAGAFRFPRRFAYGKVGEAHFRIAKA